MLIVVSHYRLVITLNNATVEVALLGEVNNFLPFLSALTPLSRPLITVFHLGGVLDAQKVLHGFQALMPKVDYLTGRIAHVHVFSDW